MKGPRLWRAMLGFFDHFATTMRKRFILLPSPFYFRLSKNKKITQRGSVACGFDSLQESTNIEKFVQVHA